MGELVATSAVHLVPIKLSVSIAKSMLGQLHHAEISPLPVTHLIEQLDSQGV
jgi:hypothetical protein